MLDVDGWKERLSVKNTNALNYHSVGVPPVFYEAPKMIMV